MEEEETATARNAPPEEVPDPELKQKPKRKPLPPTLPRNKQVLSPGETCKCGGDLRSLSEAVTEELEYIPERFIVNRIVRPRMACKCCEQIVQAPLLSRPIERSRPVSVFWRMCWSISMQIIVLCIANPRYSPVNGSTWASPHWQVGLVNRQSYWNLQPM